MAAIIHTPTGIKEGSKGHVANTPEKVGLLLKPRTKGERRKIRKDLHARGLRKLAAAKAA